MPSSHSSNLQSAEHRPRIPARAIKWTSVLSRIILGIVFCLSGYAKAIDPWGTVFKLDDYLAAMGMTIPATIVAIAAFILPAAEFALGIFNLLGCFRRTTAWSTLAFMCIMLPLTAWIALTDPVADCGCFGDAYIISNTATFWKNVVLTACAVVISITPKKFPAIITPALQWTGAAATCAFILAISMTGYYIQPLEDYRPYPVGSNLFAEYSDEDNEEDYEFIYSRNGESKSFAIDNLPDEKDGWQFVDRKSLSPVTIETDRLTIWDESGIENLTDAEAEHTGRAIYLFVAEPHGVEAASSWEINSIARNADKAGISFAAIMSADSVAIDDWRDLTMADYPIYRAEDTTIKEIVRGNPAVVYTRDNRIIWKAALSGVDSERLFTPDDKGIIYPSSPAGLPDTSNTLFVLVTVYLSAMGFIILTGHLGTLMRGGKVRRAK